MPPQMSSQRTPVESQSTSADGTDFLQRIMELIHDADLSALVRKYAEKRNVDIGFNLFELISDHYYRETFHSDILNAFLDPEGKHRGQNKYLRLFLEYIASQHEAKVDPSHYSNATTVREEGRMDILIKGSEHAIFIENKINGAPDTDEQLYRYLELVEKKKQYVCDAIIYLNLHGDKPPDMSTWKDPKQKPKVEQKLKVICAYDGSDDGSQKDLLRGWIQKCEKQSEDNSEAQHILRQYGKIIEKLGANIMNKPIMKEFYKIIKDDKLKLKTALNLKEMLDELVKYRTEMIIEKFKSDLTPFTNISNYQNWVACFTGFISGEADLELGIGVYPEWYSLEFLDRNDRSGTKSHAKEILHKMGCLNDYTFEKGRFKSRKIVAFPSEEENLFDRIASFKTELSKAIKPWPRSL
jgi:hypothetical protein